ncbi:MAG: response regulator [Burkholderiales bacterium]
MAKKILIADDEPNIVVSLEFPDEAGGLRREDRRQRRVRCAIGEFAPDLVLLDVMMPRLSGYEVCQKVRENLACAGIRIVMLSARAARSR